MQARLDMLLPSSCGATTIPDVSQCCPRSTGAEDDAPFLFAMPLVWLETTFEAVLHLASESLRLAGIRRQ